MGRSRQGQSVICNPGRYGPGQQRRFPHYARGKEVIVEDASSSCPRKVSESERHIRLPKSVSPTIGHVLEEDEGRGGKD
jgi:hypothetical protein